MSQKCRDREFELTWSLSIEICVRSGKNDSLGYIYIYIYIYIYWCVCVWGGGVGVRGVEKQTTYLKHNLIHVYDGGRYVTSTFTIFDGLDGLHESRLVVKPVQVDLAVRATVERLDSNPNGLLPDL